MNPWKEELASIDWHHPSNYQYYNPYVFIFLQIKGTVEYKSTCEVKHSSFYEIENSDNL